MSEREEKMPPLEQGLLMAMKAIDKQIAREMQRTPEERAEKGVQKWEPYATRVERVCALVMNALGDEEVDIDSVLVLSQSMAKCLQLIAGDLGRDGLGEVRTGYFRSAIEAIEKDLHHTTSILKEGEDILN